MCYFGTTIDEFLKTHILISMNGRTKRYDTHAKIPIEREPNFNINLKTRYSIKTDNYTPDRRGVIFVIFRTASNDFLFYATRSNHYEVCPFSVNYNYDRYLHDFASF